MIKTIKAFARHKGIKGHKNRNIKEIAKLYIFQKRFEDVIVLKY